MLPEFSWYMSRSTQPCWQLPASIDIRRINCCAKTNFLTTKPSKSTHSTRMNLELTNKTALVSGSTKGIGFAIASQLAAEGARVIVNGRSENAVDSALHQIRQQVPDAKLEGFAGDLSTEKAVEDLLKRFPAVDILVNNLGMFESKPFEEIINYGMSKTAQLAVSRGLAEFCAGTGVTVNAILPGPTRSAGVEEFVSQVSGGQPFADFEKEFFKTVRPSSLIKRFEAPEEIARLVTFVCSPAASGITGAALRVDGGAVPSCF